MQEPHDAGLEWHKCRGDKSYMNLRAIVVASLENLDFYQLHRGARKPIPERSGLKICSIPPWICQDIPGALPF